MALDTYSRNIPSGVLLSTPHFDLKTRARAFSNSSPLTGKLPAELYRLMFSPWRSVAVEEQFLNLRTLLLHIYRAVASNTAAGYQR